MKQEIQLFILCCVICVVTSRTLSSGFEGKPSRKLGQEICELSTSCTKDNCHMRYPGSCTQWVNCEQRKTGWVGTLMNCSHGTHFVEKFGVGSCVSPQEAKCPDDLCRNETEGFYVDINGCRGYWKCTDKGYSEPLCCPLNQTFVKGQCVDDPNCDNVDECQVLGAADAIMDVVCDPGFWGSGCQRQCSEHCLDPCNEVNGECPVCARGWQGARCTEKCTRFRGSTNYTYIERTPKQEFERACAYGTMFSEDRCLCLDDPDFIKNAAECKEDVDLDFGATGWARKNRANWNYIAGTFEAPRQEKEIQLGDKVLKVGQFDGKQNYLQIPFYRGNDKMTEIFAAEILFKPHNGKEEKNRAILMSNCQNSAAPLEILLLTDTSQIQVTVDTEDTMPNAASSTLKEPPTIILDYLPDDWNKLELYFDHKKRGSVMARNLDLNGRLISEGQAPVSSKMDGGLDLKIGYCNDNGPEVAGKKRFNGKMALLKTYLCDPGFARSEAAAPSTNVAVTPTEPTLIA